MQEDLRDLCYAEVSRISGAVLVFNDSQGDLGRTWLGHLLHRR